MKAWIIVTDDFKTYYAKEVEGESRCYFVAGNRLESFKLLEPTAFIRIENGKLQTRVGTYPLTEEYEFWLTKEACESAIRGVMG